MPTGPFFESHVLIYVELAFGFLLLLGGAEALVRGSVAIARRLDIAPLVIGLVLVGFGTSSPELLASVTAAVRGAPGIAIGNVVGSNICNVLLIVGTAAVLTPLAIDRRSLLRDGSVMLAATVALVGICYWGFVTRPLGAAFVAALAAYLVLTYRMERRKPGVPPAVQEVEEQALPRLAQSWPGMILATLAGLVGLLLGAYLLVEGAIELSRRFGVSEAVIGVSVVALGTSLPELATSAVAAARRHGDVAIGNVIGSNIYNALGIVGVAALVRPLAVPEEILSVDIWVMAASTVALVVFAVSGWRLSRREGALFLAGYGAYVVYLLDRALTGTAT
jgi:cation:H+ antiporter